MDNTRADSDKTEILIIRRGGGDDHAAHKGGAWKIAYADFVTAMMAFFLVMWLINSANEATRARVASYFNPIKLTDSQPSERGVVDPTQNKKSTGPGGAAASSQPGTGDPSAKPANPSENARASAEKREEQIMLNPYKALEALSTEGTANPTGRTVEVTAEKSGDPFDPKAWEALRRGTRGAEPGAASVQSTAELGDAQKAKTPGESNTEMASDKKPVNPGAVSKEAGATQIAGDVQDQASAAPAGIEPNARQILKNGAAADTQQNPPAVPAMQTPKGIDPQAQAQVDSIREKILQAAARAGVAGNLSISVNMTPEGMLISLADKTGDSMFEIGSAAPTPQLVTLVSAIGNLLETEQGKIVIRGHTDARQYRNLKFDNWQLSTARAHMASYMLMRGGFSEDRIFKIEGYGSTSPVEGSDPFDAENRRVEFLLKP